MKEIKAKTLLYKGEPVDERMLASGIHICGIPQLFGEHCTIEVLKRYAQLFDMHNKIKIYDKGYFERLAKCELVDVTVIIHEKEDGQ